VAIRIAIVGDSYGINPRWQPELLARSLPIVGTGDDGAPRILELPDHPFFIATLFVPQARSSAAAPHPLVTGFVRAAAASPLGRADPSQPLRS
jgi:CTP synthase (UTP-ammonia lyase)